MKWEIPKIWENSTAYIIGGGPSVSQIDLDRLRGQHVIVTNSAFEDAPWADVLYFMDYAWWDYNKEKLAQFGGLIVTIKRSFKESKRVKQLEPAPHGYLEERPGFLNYTNNSGLGAILLARRLGAKRIVLFGFDNRRVEGADNYHSRHKNQIKQEVYNKMQKDFNYKAELLKEDTEVLNATPNTALECFPVVDPEDVMPDVSAQP